MTEGPFRSYATYLRKRYGGKTRRIALDAGFGCPHRKDGRGRGGCAFCNPAGSGTGDYDRGLSVAEQMRRGMERLRSRGIDRYLAYFQAYSNTGADRATLEERYLQAIDFPGVVGLCIGSRPDQAGDPVLDLLSEIASGKSGRPPIDVCVEFGLQSANDKTLARIGRGHDVACFDDAVLRADALGLFTAAHVILGLPGEGAEEMMATARHLARLPVKAVKLHQLFIEEGCDLAPQYQRGELSTLSRGEYVTRAIGFLRRLGPDTIIMRLAGRASPEGLIAPRWTASKVPLNQEIEQVMTACGFRQGDLHERERGGGDQRQSER